MTDTGIAKGQKPSSWALCVPVSRPLFPEDLGERVVREQRGQGTPEWPAYLVQGCESILIAQIRADLVLQEVAYCKMKGQE